MYIYTYIYWFIIIIIVLIYYTCIYIYIFVYILYLFIHIIITIIIIIFLFLGGPMLAFWPTMADHGRQTLWRLIPSIGWPKGQPWFCSIVASTPLIFFFLLLSWPTFAKFFLGRQRWRPPTPFFFVVFFVRLGLQKQRLAMTDQRQQPLPFFFLIIFCQQIPNTL